MAFDLSTRDSKAASEAGTVIELIDPATNELMVDPDTGQLVTITILGIDSDKLRAVAKKNIERNVNNSNRGKSGDFDIDVAERAKYKMYAEATIAWEGIGLDSKEDLECNPKNAFRLYSDGRFRWLVEQIDMAIADRQRFFKTASPSS